jgi:hypothetical protein
VGALTLTEFQQELLAGLGNRAEDNQTITPARMVVALNLAQARISRSYDFSEMADVAFAQMNFTGTPGLDKYLVPPANVKTIHSFVLLDTSAGVSSMGQSRKVVEKPWRWFDRRFPAPEWLPPSWPEIYARWGRIIVMAPPPFLQFTAQLRFIKFATPFVLAAPTQTSDFENKDDVLINYTLGYFFKTLGRADRAIYFEGLAKEQLDEAIERDDHRPDIEISRDVEGMGAGGVSGPYWLDPFVNHA